ncbi:MAG: darcynin family protein [Aliidongia sp.]
MSSKSSSEAPFEIGMTAFMLVKTTPEWLGLAVDRRFQLLKEEVEPILKKYRDSIRLRFYDVEFYSARVTDIWVWEARDHSDWQLLVEDLRDTPFWDRYFEIVEILTGVENAYAKNHNREPLAA